MDIMIKPIVTEKATKLTEKALIAILSVFLPKLTNTRSKIWWNSFTGLRSLELTPPLYAEKTNPAGLRAAFSAARQPHGRKPSSLSAKVKQSTFSAISNKNGSKKIQAHNSGAKTQSYRCI